MSEFDPTIAGFCQRHHVCRQTVYNEINGGRLRIYKVGRATRISPDADRDWLHERERETAGTSVEI